jgi:hypothetical protein
MSRSVSETRQHKLRLKVKQHDKGEWVAGIVAELVHVCTCEMLGCTVRQFAKNLAQILTTAANTQLFVFKWYS